MWASLKQSTRSFVVYTVVKGMLEGAAGDVQTTTGSNRNLLEREIRLNMTTVGAAKVKQVLEEKIPAVPDKDKWRLAYL